MPPLLAITALSAALGAMLAACSSPPPPAPIATAPPLQPVPIDGTYGGLMQLSRGDAITAATKTRSRCTWTITPSPTS